MVAKIITGKKLRGVLHYNENKVTEGAAELLLASGFAGDVDQMNFHQKLQRFENLLMLKPSVKTNTLHISLNFDASEKIDDATMQQITMLYMEKIGFGDQPYLAYRHNDVAHDHIHIVTTNIQLDGEAISLHNIGRNQSMKACREIETDFDLIKAPSRQYKPEPGIKPIDVQKALYGTTSTKRAISNTLTAVMNNYKYTSLAELNAILKQFDVIADRGAEDSLMYQKRGLVYSLLDDQCNKVGVPIKASSLYAKPTLNNIEKEFAIHKDKRLPFKPELRERIDQVLRSGNHTERTFTDTLRKQGTIALFRRSDNGLIYGITYVDHNKKVVFNGSDLGKNYSAKAITAQFKKQSERQINQQQRQSDQPTALDNLLPKYPSHPLNPLNTLLSTTQDSDPMLPKRKRRKKKKLSI